MRITSPYFVCVCVCGVWLVCVCGLCVWCVCGVYVVCVCVWFVCVWCVCVVCVCVVCMVCVWCVWCVCVCGGVCSVCPRANVNYYKNITGVIAHITEFSLHIVNVISYSIPLGTLYHTSFTQQNSIY
jgi:hypothetical protein